MAKGAGRFVSAGDLEKFSYCPLSWWLSRDHEVDNEELEKGIDEHHKLGKSLWEIDSKEKTAQQSETLVFWYAVIATVIAILGIELLIEDDLLHLSRIMGVVALIWVLAAAFFLYKASRSTLSSRLIEYERIILIFAIVAVLIAVNAVGFVLKDDRLAQALEFVSLAWLIAASYFLYRSLKSTGIADLLRREHSLKGKIEYIDVDDSRMFRSERYGISGIPPPYGLIRYPAHEFQIDYNEDMKNLLLRKVQEIKKVTESHVVHRNHNRPGKCRSCSRKGICPEKLS
jgi:CRISPR-associated exonuclease Cas4